MPFKAERLAKFIVARHAVYKAREAGKPRPWSSNPILQRYKFCNVFRELDRVTRWISTNWREPHWDDPDFWFASVVARRCINWPPTMAKIGYPIPWDPDHFLAVMARRKVEGRQLVNSAAYKLMVSGQSGDLPELQVRLVLNSLWAARERFRPHREDALASFHARLASTPFVGNFYAGQVVADVKYVGPLRRARDWWDFAASGPGSRRGLNRVLGRPTDARWTEAEWVRQLQRLRKEVAPALGEAGIPRMHAQDLQNCLCEFDKYERVRMGEGKVRKFVPNPKPFPSVVKAIGS